MNWGILAFVIIYEVLTVVGVGLVIARKNKHSVEEGNFALAGKGLPTAQVGVTLALTMLGSAHIWGTCENAYSMGSIATWFGMYGHDDRDHTDHRSMGKKNRNRYHAGSVW